MSYFVYILKCADGTYYTGITTDPSRRLREHNAGTPRVLSISCSI
ncbi:MAG: GIY-YIG nuclease family protein [Clostridia bacterium]|nr:GIY-YIG nuclease family protein [Clostridia bacterium]